MFYSKLAIALALFFLLVSAVLPVHAAGLVPCGNPGERACSTCDIFKGFSNIINFIVFALTPPAAAIMILASGIVLIFGGSESARTMGKKMFTSVIIGLIIVYASWLIVNTIIQTLASGAQWQSGTWYTVQCSN